MNAFRKDQETGDLLCYQHNTKAFDKKCEINHKPSTPVRRNRSNKKRESRNQMESIIGHLEDDHKTLQRQLSVASPALMKPVIEAQDQLNKLKDLMNNIFASNSLLDQTDKEDTSQENPAKSHIK